MNDEQLVRYSRQIMLPQIDVAGQQKLNRANVLIVGSGGLGCPAALYLASAGVGRLVLADFDEVELSNLQRQIAHSVADIGRNKAVSAKCVIDGLNPEIRVETITKRLEGRQLTEVIDRVDLVVDCSDNFTTRFAVNASCVAAHKTLVSGAAIRLEGQVAVFRGYDPDSPCYACLYSELGDNQLSCADSGVLSPLVGVIGSLQAIEVVKLVAAFGEPLIGQLLLFDSHAMVFRKVRIRKDLKCPVCRVV